jgi:starch synthase
MRIVQVAAEFSPIAKAGGLGEVVVGLSRELSRIHEDVDVIIPKYDLIDLKKLSHIQMEVPDFKCFQDGNPHANAMWSATCEGCQLHLLEARHPAGYFHRGKIYGCEDDIARFTYFSRAVLEYLKIKKQPIDILHLHDWHVSLCAPLLKDLFANEISVKAVVLTIHNSEYQGRCLPGDLDSIGIQGLSYLTPAKMQDDHPDYPHSINLLKGGIVYSDALITVSPTYAKELLTPEMGFYLNKSFSKYKSKLTGILNGIDSKLWDPATDSHLSAQYDAERSFVAIETAKEKNKDILRKRFDLSTDKRPWIGAISRLVPQKGPELLVETLKQTVKRGGVFLLLGSAPDPIIQQEFEHLQTVYGKNQQVLLQLTYEDELAHQIYAALDFLIVPSLFEPCGLTQLFGMRYGTIPIVRATGGLKDTVFDCEDSSVPIGQRNGFTFPKATKDSLNNTLERAFHLYKSDPITFQSLIRRGMQADFSWKNPAQEYLKVYRRLLTLPAAVRLQNRPSAEAENDQ